MDGGRREERRATSEGGPPIPVIVGPTASGKTALVTALAALCGIEVISADSRQVYRGLDVGTAKPAAADRAAAPYHGLDLVEPTEPYSAGRFARDAAAWIAGARGRGRLPVVAGGTGFYLRALFDGLFEEPPADPARRERLRARLMAMPKDALAQWAGRLDPGFRGGGAQRAARAVEVALLTGRPLTVLQREAPSPVTGFVAWYARIVIPRDLLAARIAARAEAMVQGGIVAETERLLAAGVPVSARGLSGVGYPESLAVIAGRLPAAGLAAAIAAATRRYAKRQETWFRHQLRGPVFELDGCQEPAVLAQTLLAAYRAATS